MGSVTLSPEVRQIIVGFLNEAAPVNVDGVSMERGASGVTFKFEYRDERGRSHRKSISTPHETKETFTDLIVMASEWLAHQSTRTMDMIHGRPN